MQVVNYFVDEGSWEFVAIGSHSDYLNGPSSHGEAFLPGRDIRKDCLQEISLSVPFRGAEVTC